MVSSGRRDAPSAKPLERQRICSAEDPSSDWEGRALAVIGHPERTENSLANVHAPARIARLLYAAMPNGGRHAADHRSRISLEIRHDRVYEPYAQLPRSRRRYRRETRTSTSRAT